MNFNFWEALLATFIVIQVIGMVIGYHRSVGYEGFTRVILIVLWPLLFIPLHFS